MLLGGRRAAVVPIRLKLTHRPSFLAACRSTHVVMINQIPRYGMLVNAANPVAASGSHLVANRHSDKLLLGNIINRGPD